MAATKTPAKNTKRSMDKDEVFLLIELIEAYPAIITKDTNAATNRLKVKGWAEITKQFNARSGSVPRSTNQLKMKWDNLKKTARKRVSDLRLNNNQNGDDKITLPPDEIADKVKSLIGSNCSGFTYPYSDEEPFESPTMNVEVGFVDVESEDDTQTSEREDTSSGPCFSEGRKYSDNGVRERNLAIALYYTKKAEKMDLEIQILKRQLGNK